MKDTISEIRKRIRKWIIATYIVLILCLKTYKYKILYKMNRITKNVYNLYLIDALYQCYYKAIIYDLINANDAICLYKNEVDIILHG